MVAKRRRHQFQMYKHQYSGMDQTSWSWLVMAGVGAAGRQEKLRWHPSWGHNAESRRQVLRATFPLSYSVPG